MMAIMITLMVLVDEDDADVDRKESTEPPGPQQSTTVQHPLQWKAAVLPHLAMKSESW
jgi:hypothetical protein